MFTPDDLVSRSGRARPVAEPHSAAAYCLGKSEWLKSFAPQHLGDCEHFRLTFYDEELDVICHRVDAGVGSASAA